MPKSLKTSTSRDGLRATDSAPRPGDFPLGSPKSRAAARAKLRGMQEMTPYDSDCFLICSMMDCVNYQHSPNCSDIHDSEVYKRGWELHNKMYPIIPFHLNPFYKNESRYIRCSDAYGVFHALRQRLPFAGDMLHREEVTSVWGVEIVAEDVAHFQAAWKRRFPQFRCPMKFEQGKKWLRLAESKRGEDSWEEYDSPCTAPEIWASIEAEALGAKAPEIDNKNGLRAVVFREDGAESFYTEPLETAG
jgi:hypothetical protein